MIACYVEYLGFRSPPARPILRRPPPDQFTVTVTAPDESLPLNSMQACHKRTVLHTCNTATAAFTSDCTRQFANITLHTTTIRVPTDLLRRLLLNARLERCDCTSAPVHFQHDLIARLRAALMRSCMRAACNISAACRSNCFGPFCFLCKAGWHGYDHGW